MVEKPTSLYDLLASNWVGGCKMRLYKFYSAQNGIKALKKKRLKVTTGTDINDPFELTAVNLVDKKLRDAIRSWKNHMFSTMGIISFCSNWSNPVVWSHYGESHNGLCLGFDVNDSHIIRVEYVDQRLKLDESSHAPTNGLGFRLIGVGPLGRTEITLLF